MIDRLGQFVSLRAWNLAYAEYMVPGETLDRP